MRWTVGMVLLAALAVQLGWAAESGAVDASRADMVGAVGGDCFDCITNPLDCAADECNDLGDGVWEKKTGTLASTNTCFQVGTGAPGTTTCTNDTPKDCIETSTCSDAACDNCGAPSTTERDTNCRLGAYLCEGE